MPPPAPLYTKESRHEDDDSGHHTSHRHSDHLFRPRGHHNGYRDRRSADREPSTDRREHERNREGTQDRGDERHSIPSRGRGGGGLGHYDADFDRGKTIEQKQAEKSKQLFQAPMRYKTELHPSEKHQSQYVRSASVGEGGMASHNSEDKASAPSAVPDTSAENSAGASKDLSETASPEAAHRPGIIQTGVSTEVTGGIVKGKVIAERPKTSADRTDLSRLTVSRDLMANKESSATQRGQDSMATPLSSQLRPTLAAPGSPAPLPAVTLLAPRGAPAAQEHRGRPADRPRRLNGDERGKPNVVATQSGPPSSRDARSRDSRDDGVKSIGSPAPVARQLFDPRKDDPVKFSTLKVPNRLQTDSTLDSDARSIISSSTRTSVSSLSTASSNYRSAFADRTDALLDEVESTSSGAGSNAFLRELKSAYRDILRVETQLQDEDRLAKAARNEGAHLGSAEHDLEVFGEDRDDTYWVQLITLHRQ